MELSAVVVELATSLRASHGLRTPDALQAACCLQLGPEAVMLSGDADFGRFVGLRLQLILQPIGLPNGRVPLRGVKPEARMP